MLQQLQEPCKADDEIIFDIVPISYNDRGLLSSVVGVVDIEYNEMGQVVNRSYDNGLVSEFDYDDERFRLLEIKTGDLQEFDYSYDLVGNIMGINDSVNLREFSMSYDDLDRLLSVDVLNYSLGVDKSLDYSYNSLGNMLNLTFNDYNISYVYDDVKIHAVVEMNTSLIMPSDNDRFEIRDSLGDVKAWMGTSGNVVLSGSCFVGDCSSPGDNSFIIRRFLGNLYKLLNLKYIEKEVKKIYEKNTRKF